MREDEVAHFTATVSGDETVGFTVKSTFEVPVFNNVGLRKVWTDDVSADELPDSLTVHVVGSDGSDRPVTLTREGHWAATVDHLPQIDANGDWVEHSVREDTPAGFSLVSVESDVNSGWTVTNERQDGHGGAVKEAQHGSWL